MPDSPSTQTPEQRIKELEQLESSGTYSVRITFI